MPIGPIRSLALLHSQFSRYPAASRIHILIRFLTCPFWRTLHEVPQGGRVLDIGAGHGTFARLAVEAGAREVIAVEPDLRKSLLPFRHPAVRFVAGFDACIRGTFDAVAIYDATYRLTLAERDELYRRVYERVRPGGLFLLKDIDPTSRLKYRWARFQEQLSDRLLGISIGEGFHYESPAEVRKRLEAIGFTDFRAQRVDFGYPHAHIVYTARRPA